MNKKILIYGIIMMFSINLVNAIDFQYNVNESQLPMNFTDYLIINSNINATLDFIHQNFTSSISSVILNNLTYNLTFDVSLTSLPIGNYSTYFTIKKTFNLTETFTNITFLIKVLNTSRINTSLYEIGFNEYSSTICDTALPFTSSLTTSILLENDINPVCDNFLLCPSIIYPSETSVQINITIPKNTEPAIYKKIANFGSNIGNITFNFKIDNCFFDLSSFCSNISTTEQLVACQIALTENWKKLNKTTYINNTVIDYQNNTAIEYKQILPLENDTVDMMREFATSWRTVQSEKQRLEIENKDLSTNYASSLQDLQSQVLTLSNEMDIKVRQSFNDLYKENKNLTLTMEEYEKHNWSKNGVVWSIIIVLLTGLSIFGFYKAKNTLIY